MKHTWYLFDKGNQVYLHDIPPYLQRKKKCVDWKGIGVVCMGGAVLFIVSFIGLFMWGLAHASAEEMTYTGVIKDGHIYTLSEICHEN